MKTLKKHNMKYSKLHNSKKTKHVKHAKHDKHDKHDKHAKHDKNDKHDKHITHITHIKKKKNKLNKTIKYRGGSFQPQQSNQSEIDISYKLPGVLFSSSIHSETKIPDKITTINRKILFSTPIFKIKNIGIYTFNFFIEFPHPQQGYQQQQQQWNPQQGNPPQVYTQPGRGRQGNPQGYPLQGYPQQGYPQQGNPQLGYSQLGYPPQQGYPPQLGYPPQQGYPQQWQQQPQPLMIQQFQQQVIPPLQNPINFNTIKIEKTKVILFGDTLKITQNNINNAEAVLIKNNNNIPDNTEFIINITTSQNISYQQFSNMYFRFKIKK